MWEWLIGTAYYAHGYCFSWDPLLIGTHAVSDFLIFVSYTAIPIAILIFLHRRKGLQLGHLGRFFAAFIFWCGLTHLVGMLTLWFPIYDIQAVIKAITAVISLATAVLIFRLIPAALSVPSPSELQLVNGRLLDEIEAHKRTLEELRTASDKLELRVAERTRSLEEAALHSQTLVREIAHRSGNLMSVIAAIARQTSKSAKSPADLAALLAGRIEGMGRSQDLLVRHSWQSIGLRELIDTQVGPFLGKKVIDVSGPPVDVSPNAAHVLGMALYELATNATKYGSLSVPDGTVNVSWRIDDQQGEDWLLVQWKEVNGPIIEKPSRRGWGSQVTAEMTAVPLHGEAASDFARNGFKWELRVPLGRSGLALRGS